MATVRTLTPADVERIGEALFGANWRAPLVAALGLSRRTANHWMDGDFKPSPSRTVAMLSLLRERRRRIEATIDILERGL